MNAEHAFSLQPGAAQDIIDIWEFILEDNPLAARRVREDILDAIRKLVPFPQQGRKRSDLTVKPLRFQTVRNYIIAYAPDEKPLVVLARGHFARKRVILFSTQLGYLTRLCPTGISSTCLASSTGSGYLSDEASMPRLPISLPRFPAD
jgi:plasmid stabilization system protein ParE